MMWLLFVYFSYEMWLVWLLDGLEIQGRWKRESVVRLLQSPSLELRYEWQWVVTIDCLHVRIHVNLP